MFRGLTPFGRHLFRGLDRECVLKLSFYRNMRFGEVFGGSISDRFGINRCTKSECLKTGPQLDLGRAGPEAVAPLKESKEARHLRSQTATQRTKHSTRVPSGTVPDIHKNLNIQIKI